MESGVVSPSSPGTEAVRSFPSRWALSLQVSVGLSSGLREEVILTPGFQRLQLTSQANYINFRIVPGHQSVFKAF